MRTMPMPRLSSPDRLLLQAMSPSKTGARSPDLPAQPFPGPSHSGERGRIRLARETFIGTALRRLTAYRAAANFGRPRTEGGRSRAMADKKLGSKHECTNCGAKFYDFGKTEVVCPKCGANQEEPKEEITSEEE